jgi:beta-ribofuranosylaminobenzene 5'-phosphate synthase
MPRASEVRTGARLHFGPLASGAISGRCFGGIGMMVAEPAIAFRVVEHAVERSVGCSPETSERIRRLREAWRCSVAGASKDDRREADPSGALSWEFESPPVEHAGFGTGTQLSLAVASVLARRESTPWPTVTEIAQRCGRGRRSAIGLHGFAQGGFLVDAGQAGQGTLGELAVRLPVPEAWRIVILRPWDSGPGLHGVKELAAFEALPPMASSLTDRLCRLTLMEILPALQSGDCHAFGTAVAEYGRAIGNYFAPVQGGVFADPRVRELDRQWPELGQRLVQSSWGPAVVTFAPSEAVALQLRQEIMERSGPLHWPIDVVSPLNQGATIREWCISGKPDGN